MKLNIQVITYFLPALTSMAHRNTSNIGSSWILGINLDMIGDTLEGVAEHERNSFSQPFLDSPGDPLSLEQLVLALGRGRLRRPRVDLMLSLKRAQAVQVALGVLQDARLGNLKLGEESIYNIQQCRRQWSYIIVCRDCITCRACAMPLNGEK